MDKSILEEYADMKEEIKDLRRRIDKGHKELEKLNKQIVTDSVACGKKGKKPIRTVKIQGKPSFYIIRKKKTLERSISRLERMEIKILEMQNQAEEYIEQIEKSELRTMFRLYFIDDLTYPKVAMEMNNRFPKRKMKYTEDNVKKRIQRYFKNVPQCPEDL